MWLSLLFSVYLIPFFPQICILGTIGNILNIVVLTRPELGSTPINLILKWLAVTDMFVMMEYIPFTCYQYIILPGKSINLRFD